MKELADERVEPDEAWGFRRPNDDGVSAAVGEGGAGEDGGGPKTGGREEPSHGSWRRERHKRTIKSAAVILWHFLCGSPLKFVPKTFRSLIFHGVMPPFWVNVYNSTSVLT